jgi:serine/threonine-protein kinase RsbW
MEIISHTLDSTLASIDTAEAAACDFAARAGFDGAAVERIGLAVREVTANAIVHGNRHDRRKKVYVALSRTPSRLEIAISDQGPGFDPSSVADPLSPDALLRTSGRGLYLARTFTDELYVRRGDLCGATVVLVKYANGSAHQQAPDTNSASAFADSAGR